jgi:hypothetical protein
MCLRCHSRQIVSKSDAYALKSGELRAPDEEEVLKGLSKHRLFYLGDSAPNFTGLVNGRRSDALGDSGSNVLVMDEDHAWSLGL